MGVNATWAGAPPGAAAAGRNRESAAYVPVGHFLLPEDAAAARDYFWRHLYGHPRRGWLVRWPPRRRVAAAWTGWPEQRVGELLGGNCGCLWRPAAPGVSRAALGWVFAGDRLVALARVAEGVNMAFLERHRRALELLQPLAALADSTPRLLAVETDPALPPRLLLLESALAGQAPPPWGRPAAFLPAAAWLAHFQAVTRRPGHRDTAARRAQLARAIASHAGLTPCARTLALRALEAAPGTAAVAAHGDFWWANVLMTAGTGGAAAGVVDWSEFRFDEHPWHDVGFFLLTLARDSLGRGQSQPPARWLQRAFAPGARFRRHAEHWLAAYVRAGGAAADLRDLLRYLPAVMARYACFGQQAAGWTAALNAWAAMSGEAAAR